MPTVSVDKEAFYEYLGKQFTTEEFQELCFSFGIELEEDTSERELAERMGGLKVDDLSDRPILKIDVPANRYDLLCFEGISRSLQIFRGLEKPPAFQLIAPPNGKKESITVAPSTLSIRPYVVGAILRNIRFTELSYASFIDLQDKLHNNICRKRTLVAIGTHDYDTIQGPFTYQARAPSEIQFVPLNQTQSMDGNTLMQFYENDRHLSRYLPIIRDSPVYPVIEDANKIVLSLPPIINGDHSKISLDTKNILIECTATDLTKAVAVLNTVVAMFSQYCDPKFSIEPVEVRYEHSGEVYSYPDVTPREMTADVPWINSCLGLKLSAEDMAGYLNRMALLATVSAKSPNTLDIQVPITRSDVLHMCDVMEDVGIAYGYNNLTKTFPATSSVAAPLPINKLSDAVRCELAMCGWTEILPLILCSSDENFKYLNRVDDGTLAVRLANPKTVEYQVVRTSLLPGVLKTIHNNKKHALPIKVFEVSDVAFKDDSQTRRARNERHACVVMCNKVSGFEVVHGVLDQLMRMLNVPLCADGSSTGYFIRPSNDATYFPDRSAEVLYRPEASTDAIQIGTLGILHPDVLAHFDIGYPCTALEFNLEPFL